MEAKHISIPPPPPPLSPLLSQGETPNIEQNEKTTGEDVGIIVNTVPKPEEEEEKGESSETYTSLPPPAAAGHKVTSINGKTISDLTILGIKLPSFKNNPNLRIKVLIAVIISVYLLFYILQVKKKKKERKKDTTPNTSQQLYI